MPRFVNDSWFAMSPGSVPHRRCGSRNDRGATLVLRAGFSLECAGEANSDLVHTPPDNLWVQR